MQKNFLWMFILSFALWCLPMQANADGIILKDGKGFSVKDGKENLLEYAPVVFVKSLALYALGVDKDEKIHSFESGIHFFKQGQEKPFAFVPNVMAGALNDTYTLSPDKKILGLNFSPTTWGSWFFYAIPNMKMLGEVEYFTVKNDLPIWVDSNGTMGVLLGQTNPQEDFSETRMCEYDPCFASSVAYYDFKTKKNRILMKGTALCDYLLTGFDNGEVLVDAICTQKPEEWKNLPIKSETKKIRIKL